MYDIKFLEVEKIELISDNTVLCINNEMKKCSSIITNLRYLILDYPGLLYNSAEDLRISGKGYYVRKKEVIFEINIKEIDEVTEDKMVFKSGEYILIKDMDVLLYFRNKL